MGNENHEETWLGDSLEQEMYEKENKREKCTTIFQILHILSLKRFMERYLFKKSNGKQRGN